MSADQLALAPVDPLAGIIAWTRENPDGWRAVVSWAHADRAAGIDPSTRLYCCLLRRPHFAAALGLKRMSKALLVNDHASSDMARLLNRLFPDLHCPTRAAKADGWAVAS